MPPITDAATRANSSTATAISSKQKPPNKWLIIAGFSLLLGVNQFLWLTFATIVISTEAHFGVNEFFANLLTLMFPILFVLLAIHSGKVLDNIGYKKNRQLSGAAYADRLNNTLVGR